MARIGGRRLVRVLFALSLACSANNLDAQPTGMSEKQADDLLKMAGALDRGDCATVLKIGHSMIRKPSEPSLPDEAAALIYDGIVSCELELERMDDAYAHALEGTRLENSSDLLWRFRLAMETDGKKYEAAVTTVEALNRGRGATLNGVPIQWMWKLDIALEDDGQKALRRRLLAVLASDAYDPDELVGPAEDFQLSYAKLLLADGEAEAARGLVSRLKSPSVLADAMLDPATQSLLPADLDLRAAAEAELAMLKEAVARDPDRLRPIIETAGTLRLLGRPQEALMLLAGAEKALDEAARSQQVQTGSNEGDQVADSLMRPEVFSDQFFHLSWFWNSYAKTYEMLGRYEDAVRAYAKGGETEESGAPNVSQLLNLAVMQVRFAHYDDAMRTLALFDDPKRVRSPYGEMVLRFVRVCANALAGRLGETIADVNYAKAHPKDNPGGLVHLLLCVGDNDAAAAALIARLEDPDQRAKQIKALSEYDDPPVALPVDPMDARYEALKARPDVKAAIERAGGLRRFNVQAGEL